jgi:hypothetical protein
MEHKLDLTWTQYDYGGFPATLQLPNHAVDVLLNHNHLHSVEPSSWRQHLTYLVPLPPSSRTSNVTLAATSSSSENNKPWIHATVLYQYPAQYAVSRVTLTAQDSSKEFVVTSKDAFLDAISSAGLHVFHDGNKSDVLGQHWDEFISQVRAHAIRALEAYNLVCKTLEEKLAVAEISFQLSIFDSQAVLDVAGFSKCKSHQTKPSYSLPDLGTLIVELADKDVDEDHQFLIDSVVQDLNEAKEKDNNSALVRCFEMICDYLSIGREEGVKAGNPNVLLKHQRLLIICADLMWVLETKCALNRIASFMDSKLLERLLGAVTKKVELRDSILSVLKQDNSAFGSDDDQYYGFLDLFFKAANERELLDFEICTAEYVQKLHISREKTENLKWSHQDIESSFSTSSGMRIGISSANASDNWTNAKLRGGRVVNVCVNLYGQPPLSAEISRSKRENGVLLTLLSTDSLSGELGTSECSFDETNFHKLKDFSDPKDTFRMLKYAFFFVGILSEELSVDELTQKFIKFAGNGCLLRLSLTNLGPSRSGFASSSAVSSNLLKVLYKASGQDTIADDLSTFGSLVLLFENRLGLKSGRQDVDGLLPQGFKNLSYGPTSETLLPKLKQSVFAKFEQGKVPENLIVVDSGIQRPTHLGRKRGLNMRHLALLSRSKDRFPAIRQSYGVHDLIVDSFIRLHWQDVGELFLSYMSLRETIDPGATMSVYDELHEKKVLRELFDPLKEEGLIFGGMFTGAMGGGVAMLVATDKGKQVNDQGVSLLRQRLINLTELEVGNEKAKPFNHLRIFDFSVNPHGIECSSKGSI